jgi:spectinomycin phosphotransferase
MKTPLPDSEALIRALLLEHWQLVVARVHFIPHGESAYSYRVETEPGSTCYLKVVDRRTSAGQRTADHMRFSLPLQRLVAEQRLGEVTAPLPRATTQGALCITHGPLLFALYTFVAGETLANAYPMPPALVRRIGQALAALHMIHIPRQFQQHAAEDSLTAPFDLRLLADLASLSTISAHDAAYLQQLREIIWPRRELICGFLARGQDYARRASQLEVRPVLCHGDPWGGNIILESTGQLVLLDWESAVLAPPERDAFLYMSGSEADFAAFDAGYRAIQGEAVRWHAEWLAYYAYRQQLRNLAQWLHDLLYEPLDEAQRAHDLKMLGFHCLDRWEAVEEAALKLMR